MCSIVNREWLQENSRRYHRSLESSATDRAHNKFGEFTLSTVSVGGTPIENADKDQEDRCYHDTYYWSPRVYFWSQQVQSLECEVHVTVDVKEKHEISIVKDVSYLRLYK